MGKIEKAARKFNFVSKSKKWKFKYLPEWVLSEATYFEKEIKRPVVNHKIYKRGALVFVDFGVNVGNELSGGHFAVVLNQKDTQRNGVLTVVPVSSKTNKFAVELDGLISHKSVEFLMRSIKEVEISRRLLYLHLLKDDLTEEEKNERVRTYSLESTSYVEHNKYMTEEDFDKHSKELNKQIKELKTVVKKYLNFNKKSYAKCLDVRTISKTRIVKLNQFDPTGKILVSDETLEKIDKIIADNFTNLHVDKETKK